MSTHQATPEPQSLSTPQLTVQLRRSSRQSLSVLLLYLLLTVLMTWPLAQNMTISIPGDSFDGWQNYWNLWWLKTALVEQLHNPYITNALFYPTGVNLYFHTLNPFNGLFTLPIQLTAGLIPAYNTVVFFSWTIGGYGVYLLTLWILQQREDKRTLHSAFRTPHSAFLAGVIFTFSPFHMAHLLGHMQVMSLEWIPFYGLYLLRAIEERKGQGAGGKEQGARGKGQGAGDWKRSALLAGLFLILTGLCDWYFVLYLFLFTLLVIVWQFVMETGDRRPEIRDYPKHPKFGSLLSALTPPLLTCLLFAVVLSPLLIPMLHEATTYSFMVRPSTDLYIFSASLVDFFVPNRLHPLLMPASLSWIGNQVAPPSEHTIGIGYTALVLALVALWKERKRSLFWLVSAAFFLIMALGPRLHFGNITQADIPTIDTAGHEWTLYVLLNRLIPFMRISRSVSRYALMVELCVAVAAGIGLATLLQRRRSPVALGIALLGVALVLAEFWVAPYPLSPPDTPAYYTQLRTLPDAGAVLNLPVNYDRPGYLLYQTVHQKPLTVGYISRDDPRTLTERAPVLQHFRHLGPDILAIDPITAGMTVLHDLGVGVVIEDRYKMPDGEERTYTEGLAKAIFANQPPLFQDNRLTVHKVQPPANPAPYLVLGEFNWGPFVVDKKGTRSRTLTNKPALLYGYHLPPKAQLRIRYRTEPGAGLTVYSADLAQQMAAFPPAPQGHDVVVDLALTQPQQNLKSVALMATTPTGVSIEQIALATQ
ncbi:MAG: hypothetical protein U0350_16745 [Caldilineaceae bacterium]